MKSRSAHARQRGIALPMAIASLAVISLLIAGSAFFALQEVRAGRNALTERRALEAAEYGATAVARDWDAQRNVTLPLGSLLGPFHHVLAGAASASARVTRSSGTTFWVVSEGTSGVPTARAWARRVVSVMYRLALPQPDTPAALTVRDSVEVSGGGVVTGADAALMGSPLVGSCAAPAPSIAGIAAPDTSHVCDGSCGSPAGNVRGIPPMLADPAAADSLRYRSFGDRTWHSLTASTDVTLPPNATVTPGPSFAAGACRKGLADNWGDPGGHSACGSYFPVIWARGDVTISGGAGQGILLAEGDVRIANGGSFVGLVVARDDIVMLTGGGRILGAALAGDSRTAPGDHSVIDHGGLIQYSACGLHSALYGSAPLHRVRHRAWAEMF